MKIFNVQPIIINEYIYNDEYLEESKTSLDHESDFEITYAKVGELNTMFISFNILYYLQAITKEKDIFTPTGPNKWDINMSFSSKDEDSFLIKVHSCSTLKVKD